jgi:hypothetical protein
MRLPIIFFVYFASIVVVSCTAAPTGKWFDKYMIVLLENQNIASILNDPNFKNIATEGLLQTNYHGVAHPSQPNCKQTASLCAVAAIIHASYCIIVLVCSILYNTHRPHYFLS